MITLARLRQVVALAEHGTFGRAAATLNISQPALTKSIQALESALGVRLFDRQPRGVALTEFGRLVVTHTRRLVTEESELIRDIRLLAGSEVGRLDVALGPFASLQCGYPAVATLMARRPKLQIGLHVAGWRDVTKRVLDKSVEVGVAELSEAVLSERLQTELIDSRATPIFCRPGHPLLKKRTLNLRELFDFPWVHTRLPPRIAGAYPRTPVRAGHIDEFTGDFVPAVEVNVPVQHARLVQGNDFIVFGAFTMVERDLADGTLAYLPTTGVHLPTTSYGFIHLRDRSPSTAARAFMEAVHDAQSNWARHEAVLERRFGAAQSGPRLAARAGGRQTISGSQ